MDVLQSLAEEFETMKNSALAKAKAEQDGYQKAVYIQAWNVWQEALLMVQQKIGEVNIS
jgi:hypothetical protein